MRLVEPIAIKLPHPLFCRAIDYRFERLAPLRVRLDDCVFLGGIASLNQRLIASKPPAWKGASVRPCSQAWLSGTSMVESGEEEHRRCR